MKSGTITCVCETNGATLVDGKCKCAEKDYLDATAKACKACKVPKIQHWLDQTKCTCPRD